MQNKLFNSWYVDAENWGVEIIEDSKFKHTVIQIKSLDFVDEKTGQMSCEFHLIKKADSATETDYSSDEFSKLLQSIIEYILKQAIDDYANREADTK